MRTVIKKLAALVLVFFMFATSVTVAVPQVSAADVVATGECGENGGNAVYTLDSDGLFTVTGTGKMKHYWFQNSPWVTNYGDRIKSVYIDDGITLIGEFDFYNANSLKSVYIADSVTMIEGSCFRNCSNLGSIRIPQSVKQMNGACFAGCKSLKTIAFPGLEVIGDGALSYMDALESVYFSKDLKDIGAGLINTDIKDIYYGGSANDWSKVNIRHNNSKLLNATIHYNCSYEDYLFLQQTPHTKPYTANGILVDVSTASENYDFRNHQLFDENGNQLDDVKVVVSIKNISNDRLETEAMYISCFTSVSARDDCKLITINKGDTLTESFSAGFSIEKMLTGNNYLGQIYVSGWYDEDEDFMIDYSCDFTVKWDHSNERYIRGFCAENDGYSFPNTPVRTEEKYYKAAFGLNKGHTIYKHLQKEGEDPNEALCFGMSGSAADFFMHPERIQACSRDTMNTLDRRDYNNELQIDLEQYLKYVHVIQHAKKVSKNEKNQQFSKIYNHILDHLNNNKAPVIIGLRNIPPISFQNGIWNEQDCHAVLAIGIDGGDILIYDPNFPGQTRRIVNTGEKWVYYGNSVYSSADIGVFNYFDDLPDVYELIKNDNLQSVSYNQNLILTDHPERIQDGDSKLQGIFGSFNSAEGNTYGTNLFWLEDHQIDAVNETDESFDIKMLADTRSLLVSMPVGSRVNMSIEPDERAEMILDVEAGTDVTFTYSEVWGDKILDYQVSGEALNGTINMTETDTGMIVTGLNLLTITVSEEDGQIIDEINVGVTDGREVNLFVNEDHNVISSDFAEADPESQVEPTEPQSSLCKYCKQDHGKTFVGRLIAFIHSILYFFAHLFGKM